MSYSTRNPARGQPGRGGPIQSQQGRGGGPAPQQTKIIYHQQGGRGQPAVGGGQQQYQIQQQQQQQQTPQQQKPLKQELPPLPDQPIEEGGDGDMEGVSEQKLKWLKKKSTLTKVSKKVKRKRLNLRLRKFIQPKSPAVVLNELKSGVKYRNADQNKPFLQGSLHTMICEIDGKEIRGQGLSKDQAKQAAAENAIKILIAQRVKQAKEAGQSKSNGATEGEGMDVDKEEDEESEVPWCTLASYALYKLLSEWNKERDPTVAEIIPLLMPSNNPSAATPAVQGAGTPKVAKPSPMKKPLENPTEHHPVMLLNYMRPGVIFEDFGSEGSQPNVIFTLGTSVDDQNFTGRGRSKKEAKKECAKAVLEKVYNIVYPADTPIAQNPPAPGQGR